jgi:hypothetical protein
MNTTQTLILLTGSALIALELTPPPPAPPVSLTPAPTHITRTLDTAHRLERRLERLHRHAAAEHEPIPRAELCEDKTPPAELAPLKLSR